MAKYNEKMSDLESAIRNYNIKHNYIPLPHVQKKHDSKVSDAKDSLYHPGYEVREAIWRRKIGIPFPLLFQKPAEGVNESIVSEEWLKTELTYLNLRYPGDKLEQVKPEKYEPIQGFMIKPILSETTDQDVKKPLKKKITPPGPLVISNCDKKFVSTKNYSPQADVPVIPINYRFHFGEPPRPTAKLSFKEFDKIFEELHFNLDDSKEKKKKFKIKSKTSHKKISDSSLESESKEAVTKNSNENLKFTTQNGDGHISVDVKNTEEETEITLKMKIKNDNHGKKQKRRLKFRKLELF